MATVQIADVYEPLTFSAGVDEAAIELNAFLRSGVMAPNAQIQLQASAGGRIGDIAYYGPLGTAEPNYGSDDPSSSAIPKNISGLKDIWRLAAMNEHWSTMDLAQELGLKDPLTAIINKVGGFWATQVEKRLIQSNMGILADNVVNDGGDMVYSIATDAVLPVTTDEMISPQAVIMAAQTMGDHKTNLAAIAMHSFVHASLQAQNVIVTEENPAGQPTGIQTYLGYVVIVDDSLPAVMGTNRITYTSILYAADAIGNAQGRVETPSELSREALTGDGGGQTILSSRKNEIIHPYGFQFTSASVAAESPDLSELAAGANWDRVVDRKNVGIAFLQTNG